MLNSFWLFYLFFVFNFLINYVVFDSLFGWEQSGLNSKYVYFVNVDY